jgi:Tol biopolymer transport system component
MISSAGSPRKSRRRTQVSLISAMRTRLTSGPSQNSRPVWSPDGSRIVFTTDRKHQGDLYTKPVTGHGGEEPFLEGEGQRFADDWSPDGTFLAVEIREPRGERKVALSVVPASGEKTPKVFLQRGIGIGEARFLAGRPLDRLYLAGVGPQ